MLSKINESINKINTENALLLGDFNFRDIDWNTLTSPHAIDQSFIDTITDNLLTQMVKDPTRGNNILDLALVGDPQSVISCVVLEQFGTSDHQMVKVEMNCPIPRINKAPRKVYLFTEGYLVHGG